MHPNSQFNTFLVLMQVDDSYAWAAETVLRKKY